jgi:thymidylate synthase
MNREEQQVLDLFQELLDKYDKQGSRQVRDGHSRVSLFGKQLRFDLSKSFPLLTHRQFFVRGIFE